MKTFSKLALIAASLIITVTTLSGCGSKADLDPASVVKISKSVSWNENTSQFEKKINGFQFPKFESKAKPKIAEVLNSKMDNLLNDYFDPIQQDPSNLGNYPEFDIKGEFLNKVGNFITYKISGYTFVGDANHGQPINEFYVFDYETEKQVYLSYFIPKLSNSTISSLAYRQLKFSLGFDAGFYDYLPENLSDVSSDLQWWPDLDGIRLFFPVYSVAPYSEGPQEALISWIDIRDEYPNPESASFKVISTLVSDTVLDYYLHIDESMNGTYITVTKVENGSEASTIGFWWASEGIYYYKGVIGTQNLKYTINFVSGKSSKFNMELFSSKPLTFNRDSKNNLRVVGPVSDLKYIDLLLNRIEAPIGTELFLDAEKAGWYNQD